MSVYSSIYRADIVRQAADGANVLVGRGIIVDPVEKEKALFFLDHGITREQLVEKARIIARENFESRAVGGLVYGDPPTDICDTRGLSPKRTRYARYFEWRFREAKKLADLESKKAYLDSLIETPKATEAEIRKVITKTAARLMGGDGGDSGDSSKRQALEARLGSERHAADAAREAMPQIEDEIEIAQLRTRALDQRQAEFIGPVIIEIANEIGLGELYLKKVKELRTVVELINGLSATAGEYGTFRGLEAKANIGKQLEPTEAVRLPTPALKCIESADANALYLTHKAETLPWNQLKQSLILDPRHNAKNFIPLPK